MSKSADTKDGGAAPGGEDALVVQRQAKATRVRERGADPFANDVDASARSFIGDQRRRYESALIDEAELRYDPERVAKLSGGDVVNCVGRMVARRGFGKVSFLRLRDATGEIQVFAKKDILGEFFVALEDIDIADHIAVSGPMMVTKTGELSIEAQSLRLVTKAYRPLPDKWHGLSDVDLRYRRRYVDMVANPSVAAALRARSFIVQGLRDFLDAHQFVEVETPTLHTLVGGASARPFKTHHNTLDMELFLRIAPELYLKRMLVGGFERVYEIGRCYRNEGISTRHNPEFTMLEFYQAYATYSTLMTMTEELFRHVDRFLSDKMRAAGMGETYDQWVEGRRYTLGDRFARVPMRTAVERACDSADVPKAIVDDLASLAAGAPQEAASSERIKGFCKGSERARAIDWGNFRKGLAGCDTAGDRLFCAYEYLSEPFLTEDYRSGDGTKSVPVFIIDYPIEVSPLARRKDDDPTLTDRFELFIDGREICNAFSELNDPEDQAARFRDQVERKGRGAEETMDYDEDYIRALEHGMPPAAGFGLGVDRLTMMLAGQASIRDVIAFPLMRPENKT